MALTAALATTALMLGTIYHFPVLEVIVLAIGAAVCIGRFVFFAYHAARASRQLQLEARFVKQPFEKRPLVTCLQNNDTHLWAGSHTCKALRRALHLPLPRLMRAEEKVERLSRFFRLAYLPLRLQFTRVHGWTLGALLVLTLLFFIAPGSAGSLPLAGSVLLVVGLFETALWYQRHQIRNQLEVYLRGLSKWALRERQHGALRADQNKPYQHDLLYNSPRWFESSPEHVTHQKAA